MCRSRSPTGRATTTIYGTTNNPWDSARTPGGSSGGRRRRWRPVTSALELGSDIGGSLRAPAHYCGVFAHKPTQALVPGRGQTPPGGPALPVDVDLAVVGPMARSAGRPQLAARCDRGPRCARRNRLPTGLAPAPARRPQEFPSSRPQLASSGADGQHGACRRGTAWSGLPRQASRSRARARCCPSMADRGTNLRAVAPSFFAADMPMERSRRIQDLAAALPAERYQLVAATRLRAIVLSHRDWVAASRIRLGGCSSGWREVFRRVGPRGLPGHADAGLPARPHAAAVATDPIDDKDYPYDDQVVWPGVATLPGLPATAVPIDRPTRGCPSGCSRRPVSGRSHAARVRQADRAGVRRIRASAGLPG